MHVVTCNPASASIFLQTHTLSTLPQISSDNHKNVSSPDNPSVVPACCLVKTCHMFFLHHAMTGTALGCLKIYMIMGIHASSLRMPREKNVRLATSMN